MGLKRLNYIEWLLHRCDDCSVSPAEIDCVQSAVANETAYVQLHGDAAWKARSAIADIARYLEASRTNCAVPHARDKAWEALEHLRVMLAEAPPSVMARALARVGSDRNASSTM